MRTQELYKGNINAYDYSQASKKLSWRHRKFSLSLLPLFEIHIPELIS